jgi:PAS domain S-box-containing protein
MSQIVSADRRLLVVSHRAEVRQVLNQVLEESPYSITFVEDGDSALTMSARQRPHGIVLDAALGVAVCEALRAQVRTTPILALTDSLHPSVIDRILDAGADDTILMPLHAPTLLRRLGALLGVRPISRPSGLLDITNEGQALFRALFEHLPDAIFLLDADTLTILDCNEVACQMNGYSREELIGQPIDVVNAFPDSAEPTVFYDPTITTLDNYGALLRQKGQLHYETYHRRKDGTIFPIEVSTCIIRVGGRELVLGIDRDITERKRAEEALKISEDRYRLMTVYATDMISRHSADTRFIYVTPACERLLGYKPEELIGQMWPDLVHPADLATFYEQGAKTLERDDVLTTTFRMQHKDGHCTWFETTFRNLRNPNTGLIEELICVSRDVSDRKEAEDAEREQHLLSEALRNSAAVLKGSVRTDETLDAILIQAAKVVPYDTASISLIEDGIARIVRCRGFEEYGLEETILSYQFKMADTYSFYGPLLEKQQPIIIEDVQKDATWYITPDTAWIRANLTVPVVVHNKVIGLLHLDSKTPGAFTPEQAQLLHSFADQTAIAIQSAQRYDELQALYHATSFLFASFDADNLYGLGQQITQAVVQEFGKVDCGLLLLEPGNNLSLLARAGEFRVNTPLPILLDGPGLIPYGIRNGEVVYAPDVRQDERYVNGDNRTRSELVIPLHTHGTVLGALDLQSPDLDAFTADDQRVLYAFAQRAATAIENLQYAQSLESRVIKRTHELQQTKEQVEAILNNSSDAIIVTYVDGTIQRVNPAFETLFGYQDNEAVGLLLSGVVASYDVDLLNASLEAAVMDSRASRIEIALHRKDGVLFDADVVISPILEHRDQHSLGVVCSIRDITERKRMELELRRALEQERELNELKTRFVAMASHEFRTPLSMIMTASELLQNYSHKMTEEQRSERLLRIQTEVKNMVRLIDDVLVVSRSADSGTMAFDPAPLNLLDFCNHLLNELRSESSVTQEIELTHTGEYIHLNLDQKFLRDILNNLLSNAVKYSPPGSKIRLNLNCGETQTVISVEDQGMGIPEEDQKRLFEAFHRGRNVGLVPGTGLGLTIAKQATELHGGIISFKSQVGVGTTFTVTLPTVLVEDGKHDY